MEDIESDAKQRGMLAVNPREKIESVDLGLTPVRIH